MTENIPPMVAAAAANPNEGLSGGSGAVTGHDSTQNTNPNRGIPYYEKLRRELKDTLQRKRLMDKSMVRDYLLLRFPRSLPPVWVLGI